MFRQVQNLKQHNGSVAQHHCNDALFNLLQEYAQNVHTDNQLVVKSKTFVGSLDLDTHRDQLVK